MPGPTGHDDVRKASPRPANAVNPLRRSAGDDPVKQGPEDGATFETRVVDTYLNPFFGYTCKVLGDYHAAQDVLQDGMLRLINACRSEPEHVEGTPGYAWAILRNALFDHLRKQRRIQKLSGSDVTDDGVTTRGTSSSTENDVVKRILLQRAIQELPERHREIFYLRHYGGFKPAEIAEMLGLKETTASNYLSSAKNQLRAWFDELE